MFTTIMLHSPYAAVRSYFYCRYVVVPSAREDTLRRTAPGPVYELQTLQVCTRLSTRFTQSFQAAFATCKSQLLLCAPTALTAIFQMPSPTNGTGFVGAGAGGSARHRSVFFLIVLSTHYTVCA